jgi:hypothetical protein
MACLLSAAEKSGLVVMARVAVVRALHADNPTPAKTTAPRKKVTKKYRIVSWSRLREVYRNTPRKLRLSDVTEMFEQMKDHG